MAAPSKTSVVLGYHGTTLANAQQIVAGSPFRLSNNPWDWLGPGIYFWQDAPRLAAHWAQRMPKGKGQQLAIVEAEISLTRCLDLFDVDGLALIQSCWRRYKDECAKLKVPLKAQIPFHVVSGRCVMPNRWGHNRADCELFKTLIGLSRESGDPITTVRSAFVEGEGIHPTSFIFDLAHVQIAVLDLSVVRVTNMIPI